MRPAPARRPSGCSFSRLVSLGEASWRDRRGRRRSLPIPFSSMSIIAGDGSIRGPREGSEMRLRHVEVFNAVMLTGSVSGAARLINVTQPAVSRTLQHAELQLGLTLFHRVRNRLVPTPEALALAPHVERVFADLDAVRRVATSLKSGAAANEVRVLSILTLGHEVLPHALTLFRAKHPDVQVSFRTLHSPEILASLALLVA